MSTALARLEEQILSLHGRLSLRPTLEAAAQIGGLLTEAKTEIPKGGFHGWVRSRLKISPRLAQMYMEIANAQSISRQPLPENLSIDKFLRMLRAARKPRPEPPPDTLDRLVPQARVYKADCRSWKGWPEQADAICVDPPWQSADLYTWLGRWAAHILRPGGLLLCQCGTHDLPERLTSLAAGGLTYVWIMSMVYPDARRVPPAFGFSSCWRPVLVFARGRYEPGRVLSTDTFTVRQNGQNKNYHVWEQPVDPWTGWTERLTAPGAVILDPCAGAATTGVATLRAGGGRTWIGTDCDDGAVRTARRRLREELERVKGAASDAEPAPG